MEMFKYCLSYRCGRRGGSTVNRGHACHSFRHKPPYPCVDKASADADDGGNGGEGDAISDQ